MGSFREDGFMQGSFTKDTLLLVNFVTAVHQEAQVLGMSLRSSLVEVLQDATSKLVLANFQGLLLISSGRSLSASLLHNPRGLEVTEIAGYVKRGVLVIVLHV